MIPFAAMNAIRRFFAVVFLSRYFPPRDIPEPPAIAIAGMRMNMPFKIMDFTKAIVSGEPNSSE